ncbi:MAG TPA: DUF4388 domain-containing protein, partial [Candidatus Acidoferrum sp.]|nr:DUF4388 domain-containing protein [Candidatus Acidoferrum sp.]
DVFTKAQSGEITIRNGAIVHAQAGERAGEAAFKYLLTLQGGEFRLKPYREPEQITITRNWEHLLMEAAQLRDEVADPASAETTSVEQRAAAHAPLPQLALQPEELNLTQPARQFIAVSVDGDPLAALTSDDSHVAALAQLASSVQLWDCALPIGRPELFEATTASSEVALQFHPEAAVLAIRERRPRE